jgi:hypothetical protein
MGADQVGVADGCVYGCRISELSFKALRIKQHFSSRRLVPRGVWQSKHRRSKRQARVERQTMPSPRETILAALHARLSVLPATALRGEVLPERVPAEGLLILRDGEPGEPEVTLSPLRYHYQHRAEIEAVVQGADRDAAFDTLTARIGTALAADRTLGGLCDWVEAEAPRPVDLPVEGAASLKAAVIPVVLHYSTADPLG